MKQKRNTVKRNDTPRKSSALYIGHYGTCYSYENGYLWNKKMESNTSKQFILILNFILILRRILIIKERMVKDW